MAKTSFKTIANYYKPVKINLKVPASGFKLPKTPRITAPKPPKISTLMRGSKWT